MVTEETFKNYIESLGHIPACSSICVGKILRDYKERNKLEFEFFTNQHNLCWYVSDDWKEINKHLKVSFTTHIREFKLHEILYV